MELHPFLCPKIGYNSMVHASAVCVICAVQVWNMLGGVMVNSTTFLLAPWLCYLRSLFYYRVIIEDEEELSLRLFLMFGYLTSEMKWRYSLALYILCGISQAWILTSSICIFIHVSLCFAIPFHTCFSIQLLGDDNDLKPIHPNKFTVHCLKPLVWESILIFQ